MTAPELKSNHPFGTASGSERVSHSCTHRLATARPIDLPERELTY